MNKKRLKKEMVFGLASSVAQVIRFFEDKIFDAKECPEAAWKQFLMKYEEVYSPVVKELIEEYVIWDNVPDDLSTYSEGNTIDDILKKNHFILTDVGPHGDIWHKFREIDESRKTRFIELGKSLVTTIDNIDWSEPPISLSIHHWHILRTCVRGIFNELMDLRGVPYIINPHTLLHSHDEPRVEGGAVTPFRDGMKKETMAEEETCGDGLEVRDDGDGCPSCSG